MVVPTATLWQLSFDVRTIHSQVLEIVVLAMTAAIGLINRLALPKITFHGRVDLEVHVNDEVWTRVLCIHDGCPLNSSRSEPTEHGKKQPSHSEIPGGGG